MTHPIRPLQNGQTTGGEPFEIIEDSQLKAGKGFSMVEVMMRKEDAVASLKELVHLAKQQNRAD